MSSLVSGFCVAFSMYSIIPMPQIAWKKQTMRYALCFLPLVGVIISICEFLWYSFCISFQAASLFYAVGASLLPVFLSGGIHLDGFTDTCDAIGSHREPERRLEILKDPNIGAFGALGMIAFLLGETALFTQIYQAPHALYLVLAAFPLSRMAGGRTIVALPCAKNTGLAYIFAENSEKEKSSRTLFAELIIGSLILFLCAPSFWSVVSVVLLLGWMVCHARLCSRQFGGITGDLAGFFISLAELLFVIMAAIGGLVG